MSLFQDQDDPMLAGAQSALRGLSGQVALGELGWVELLPLVDEDDEARRAVFALFRAQGRELSTSDAVGRLMAMPYVGPAADVGPVVSAVERASSRRGERRVLIGPTPHGLVLIDRPGSGASLVDASALRWLNVDLPGGLGIHEIEGEIPELPVWRTEEEAAGAWARRIQLGRLAISVEILGAAEAAVAIAVQYSIDREQFGRPIGSFQAVRHLLAAARVDCAAIEALAAQAIDAYPDIPPGHDAIVKAVAGRNGRRACEHSLQVLGAIGFTTEHSHHGYHSRVLALDALLGSSTALSHELAVSLRTSGGSRPDLRLPAVGES